MNVMDPLTSVYFIGQATYICEYCDTYDHSRLVHLQLLGVQIISSTLSSTSLSYTFEKPTQYQLSIMLNNKDNEMTHTLMKQLHIKLLCLLPQNFAPLNKDIRKCI